MILGIRMTPRINRATLISRLAGNRDGAVAVLFAVMLPVLILAVGIAVDYMRAIQLRTALQGAVNSAALAGAKVYLDTSAASAAQTMASNYVTAAQAYLPPNTNFSSSAVASAGYAYGTSSGTVGYNVSVTASAKLQTVFIPSFMSSGFTVSVAAVAENPIVTATADFSGWYSSAGDQNTISWYDVPSNNGTPANSALNQIYSNASGAHNQTAPTFQTTSGQKIGFALKNVTGGNAGYGSNHYGGAEGSTHYFYSHYFPPSKIAYPSVTQNCSLQSETVSGSNLTDQTAPSNGSCTNTSPQYATITCSQLGSTIVRYFWNDMGGPTDDKDYNDAEYNISCTGVTSSSEIAAGNGPTQIVLVK